MRRGQIRNASVSWGFFDGLVRGRLEVALTLSLRGGGGEPPTRSTGKEHRIEHLIGIRVVSDGVENWP